jgi:hypothetical protein
VSLSVWWPECGVCLGCGVWHRLQLLVQQMLRLPLPDGCKRQLCVLWLDVSFVCACV